MSFSEQDRKRAASVAFQSKVWSEQPRQLIDGLRQMEQGEVVLGVMESLLSERNRTNKDQAVKCPLNILLTAKGFVLIGHIVLEGSMSWMDLHVSYFDKLEMTADTALKKVRNRISDYLSESREVSKSYLVDLAYPLSKSALVSRATPQTNRTPPRSVIRKWCCFLS